jgi:hypothetical protein
MNSALLYLAWFRMFSAMGFLSWFELESYNEKLVGAHPHLIHIFLDWGLEQSSRWTGHPALVLPIEIQAGEMPDHASHRDGAVPPRATKVKVELIVLDILIASDCMLRPCSAHIGV